MSPITPLSVVSAHEQVDSIKMSKPTKGDLAKAAVKFEEDSTKGFLGGKFTIDKKPFVLQFNTVLSTDGINSFDGNKYGTGTEYSIGVPAEEEENFLFESLLSKMIEFAEANGLGAWDSNAVVKNDQIFFKIKFKDGKSKAKTTPALRLNNVEKQKFSTDDKVVIIAEPKPYFSFDGATMGIYFDVKEIKFV